MKFSFEGIPQHCGYVEFGYESGINAGHRPRAYIQFIVGSGAPKSLTTCYASVRDEDRLILSQALAYALNGDHDLASKTFVDVLVSTHSKDWDTFTNSGYLWLVNKTGVFGRAIRVCTEDYLVAGKSSIVRDLSESLGYQVTEMQVGDLNDDQWIENLLNAANPKSIVVFGNA